MQVTKQISLAVSLFVLFARAEAQGEFIALCEVRVWASAHIVASFMI